jgi:hypothetical protein
MVFAGHAGHQLWRRLGDVLEGFEQVLQPGRGDDLQDDCGLVGGVPEGVPLPARFEDQVAGVAEGLLAAEHVAAMSSTDSASSQPPTIHWKGQNRLPGW